MMAGTADEGVAESRRESAKVGEGSSRPRSVWTGLSADWTGDGPVTLSWRQSEVLSAALPLAADDGLVEGGRDEWLDGGRAGHVATKCLRPVLAPASTRAGMSFLADRDQAIAVGEVQGHRSASATCIGCHHVRRHMSARDLNPYECDLRRCSPGPYQERWGVHHYRSGLDLDGHGGAVEAHSALAGQDVHAAVRTGRRDVADESFCFKQIADQSGELMALEPLGEPSADLVTPNLSEIDGGISDFLRLDDGRRVHRAITVRDGGRWSGKQCLYPLLRVVPADLANGEECPQGVQKILVDDITGNAIGDPVDWALMADSVYGVRDILITPGEAAEGNGGGGLQRQGNQVAGVHPEAERTDLTGPVRKRRWFRIWVRRVQSRAYLLRAADLRQVTKLGPPYSDHTRGQRVVLTFAAATCTNHSKSHGCHHLATAPALSARGCNRGPAIGTLRPSRRMCKGFVCERI